MAHGDFKDLSSKTASNKVSCDKEFDIAKNTKYHGYWRRFASMIYNFFDKKSPVTHAKKVDAHTWTRINSNLDYDNRHPLDLATRQIAFSMFITNMLGLFF